MAELSAEDAVATRPLAMLFVVMQPVGGGVGEVPPVETPLPMKSIQFTPEQIRSRALEDEVHRVRPRGAGEVRVDVDVALVGRNRGRAEQRPRRRVETHLDRAARHGADAIAHAGDVLEIDGREGDPIVGVDARHLGQPARGIAGAGDADAAAAS